MAVSWYGPHSTRQGQVYFRGANPRGDGGTCPPHEFEGGGHNIKCPPHEFKNTCVHNYLNFNSLWLFFSSHTILHFSVSNSPNIFIGLVIKCQNFRRAPRANFQYRITIFRVQAPNTCVHNYQNFNSLWLFFLHTLQFIFLYHIVPIFSLAW